MRKKRLALVVATLALLGVPSTASAVDPTQPAYGGPMTGAQEVPAVATTATGHGTAVISADGSTITYLVTYSGLSGPAIGAHFHTGAAGVAGGIILPLSPVVGPSPMSGTLTAANLTPSGSVTTFAQAVAAIRAGTSYINVHTAANPGGEIRTQTLALGDAYFADLTGAQEVPAVATSATGKGLAVISADGSTITYLVTYSGLSGPEIGAHFHTGAAGVAGGVILPFSPVVGPSPMSGTLTAADLTPSGSVTTFAQAVAAIRAGTSYFNVHTPANPGGEIRGQVGVTVTAPAPAPTAAPPAPTVPPTSVDSPVVPAGDAGAIGLVMLAGFLVAAATIARIERRRSSSRR